MVPEHERQALALQPGAATAVHTNVRFKRNKAKGPNPLAAKKKKRAAEPAMPAMALADSEARARGGAPPIAASRPRRTRGRNGSGQDGGTEAPTSTNKMVVFCSKR